MPGQGEFATGHSTNWFKLSFVCLFLSNHCGSSRVETKINMQSPCSRDLVIICRRKERREKRGRRGEREDGKEGWDNVSSISFFVVVKDISFSLIFF